MAFKIEGLLDRIGINSRKPRLGVAFSGGGAKGFTHIGALMAFETFGMKPDIVSGVSAGSIACTLYAAGLTPTDMMACFEEYDSFGSFAEVPHPEELEIPAVVCATDIEEGKSVGWSKGEIVPRVMASCSIPIIFQPVKINGVNYVDGGVLRNLPAWAIRKHCKTLYGLNCAPLDRDYKFKGTLLDISMRTYSLMSKANTLQDLELCDYVVRSPGQRIGTFELSSLRNAVKVGYDATCKVLEEALKKK